ncbi:hypothetical protein CLV36_101370 [Laceyella sediminis]|uniref:Uncharacterized protein n=2 Tax=Laceyella TaxID=292635 RepID=A0AA46AEK1_9BACL|nr:MULTISPECIES: hypothetical protein [Laceyella]PRZ17266.1 hypothetical protein CLV36_101370 [Laceyella sediminis]SMP13772.1 hypothetical protein SAMN06265361_102505 [Laceyella tengchongensis]
MHNPRQETELHFSPQPGESSFSVDSSLDEGIRHVQNAIQQMYSQAGNHDNE